MFGKKKFKGQPVEITVSPAKPANTLARALARKRRLEQMFKKMKDRDNLPAEYDALRDEYNILSIQCKGAG